MNWMTKLGEKLNFNQEVYILSLILAFIFMAVGVILGGIYNIFSIMAAVFCGITVAFHIYKRDDDMAYGYKIRDIIRNIWRRR